MPGLKSPRLFEMFSKNVSSLPTRTGVKEIRTLLRREKATRKREGNEQRERERERRADISPIVVAVLAIIKRIGLPCNL